MARRKSLADAVARSPAARLSTGGAPCQTCSFEARARLEAECRRWNELRETRQTTAPWSMLHRALIEEMQYPVRDIRSLIRHLERCCGWTIF